MKVLLIQRKNNIIASLRTAYKATRFETVVADSHKDAIRLLESDILIEVVIFDTQLAYDTDFEFLRYVRNSRRLNRIPIIMTCGKCPTSIIQNAILHGASDIIMVPFDRQVLIEKTRKAIARGKHVILIVDDDPIIIGLLKYVIELERYKTLCVASAEEALEVLSKNRVSAIISDIFLPGGQSGLDFMIQVKKETKSMPIILITGNSDRVTPAQAVSAGADGFIKKPFKNTEIIQTIRKLVKSR